MRLYRTLQSSSSQFGLVFFFVVVGLAEIPFSWVMLSVRDSMTSFNLDISVVWLCNVYGVSDFVKVMKFTD